jgi:hypothetical protein
MAIRILGGYVTGGLGSQLAVVEALFDGLGWVPDAWSEGGAATHEH